MELTSTSRLPLALPGFEHVHRGWNKTYNAFSARLMPGEYYVTTHNEAIYTTLGSCISACIRDCMTGVGGMNHFMLPTSGATKKESRRASSLSVATRYGNFAMEHLINEILKNGGKRENLEVKLFGGGRVMAGMTDVGMNNIEFAHDYLQTEGLRVISEDVGDVFPRMVAYYPASGKAHVKRLRSLHTNIIVDQEVKYLQTIAAKPVGGDVELF